MAGYGRCWASGNAALVSWVLGTTLAAAAISTVCANATLAQTDAPAEAAKQNVVTVDGDVLLGGGLVTVPAAPDPNERGIRIDSDGTVSINGGVLTVAPGGPAKGRLTLGETRLQIDDAGTVMVDGLIRIDPDGTITVNDLAGNTLYSENPFLRVVGSVFVRRSDYAQAAGCIASGVGQCDADGYAACMAGSPVPHYEGANCFWPLGYPDRAPATCTLIDCVGRVGPGNAFQAGSFTQETYIRPTDCKAKGVANCPSGKDGGGACAAGEQVKVAEYGYNDAGQGIETFYCYGRPEMR